jgi:DNA-binding transcriptional LysR family regulator
MDLERERMHTLEHMATFVQIVESGSIAAAARVLGVSQPAASRRLAALEEELGVALLLRTTRTLALTQGGEQFLEHCREVMERTEQVCESLRTGQDAVAGRVVISAPVTYAMHRIAPRLHAWHQEHPGLEIELRLEDRAVELVAEGVDIAVRGGMEPPDSPGLIARRLGSWGRALVAAPAIAASVAHLDCPRKLDEHTLLGHISASGSLRSWVLRDEVGEACEIAPGGPLRSNSLEALLRACEDGMGIAMLPDWLAAPGLEAGRLARVLPAHHGDEATLWALYPAQRRHAARVRACLALLATSAPQ